MRVVPIKFARKEPCVAAEAPIDRPPLAFLRHLPDYVQVFSPRTRAVRRAETMAMNAVTSWPLPRSTRDVVLLHCELMNVLLIPGFLSHILPPGQEDVRMRLRVHVCARWQPGTQYEMRCQCEKDMKCVFNVGKI